MQGTSAARGDGRRSNHTKLIANTTGIDALSFKDSSRAASRILGTNELGQTVVIDTVSSIRSETSIKSERDKWTNKWEFLFVCISNCVGIGNVWRFPFQVKSNGGGAFLIPYFIVLFCCTRPLYFMELSLGQFSTRGMIEVWKCAPLFKGVGILVLIVTYIIISFYASVLAVCVVYFGYSFFDPLPWSTCNLDLYPDKSNKLVFKDFNCTDNKAVYSYLNSTGGVVKVMPGNAELFFKYGVMNIHDDLDNGLGGVQWNLLLGLIVVWVMSFASTLSGPKSFGKVSYFLVCFPYVMLVILFIRSMTLPGAAKGIKYFFEPEWEKILTFRVWYEALIQSLWTLTVGFGVLTTFGSYNQFGHKLLRDTTVVSLADTFTSLLAGAVVFGMLGNLAEVSGVPLENLPGGHGLAFVAYPETLVKFSGSGGLPQFLSICFFTMLLLLGVGTVASCVQCMSATFVDCLSQENVSKTAVHCVVTLVYLVSGIIYITQGGFHALAIVDNSVSEYVLFYAVFLEVTGVAYGYGMKNYVKDMQFMVQTTDTKQPSWTWSLFTWWGYSMPPLLLAVCIYAFVTTGQPTISDPLPKPFPSWVIWGGRLLTIGCICLPISIAIHQVVTTTGTVSGFKAKLIATVTPDESWGPVNPETRTRWLFFRQGFDGNTWLYTKIFKLDKRNVSGRSSAEMEPAELKDEAAREYEMH